MRLVSALLLALVVFAWGQKSEKKGKLLAIEVVETSARRMTDGTIHLDGRVVNTGDRPIEGLVILFDFIAPEGRVISTKKFATDDEVLDLGHETAFQAKLADHVRAVRYRIGATDRVERDLRVARPGPYVIE